MSQYDAREVADLLSRFDFKILREQEGDFSPSHRKYLCEFSQPGYETFSTSYQCNPEVHGQPTAADVFAALVSDAAKECRVASGKLEDHDEQAPEHANEYDAGNEH